MTTVSAQYERARGALANIFLAIDRARNVEVVALRRSIRNWESKYTAIRTVLDPEGYYPESIWTLADLAKLRSSQLRVAELLEETSEAGPVQKIWEFEGQKYVADGEPRELKEGDVYVTRVACWGVTVGSAYRALPGFRGVRQILKPLAYSEPQKISGRRYTLGRRVFEEIGETRFVRRKEWYVSQKLSNVRGRPRKSDRRLPGPHRILREVPQ